MKLDEGRTDGYTHVYGISVMLHLMQFVQRTFWTHCS